MNDDADMTELQEAVEMATLDREMAEEKVSFFTVIFLLFKNSSIPLIWIVFIQICETVNSI